MRENLGDEVQDLTEQIGEETQGLANLEQEVEDCCQEEMQLTQVLSQYQVAMTTSGKHCID